MSQLLPVSVNTLSEPDSSRGRVVAGGERFTVPVVTLGERVHHDLHLVLWALRGRSSIVVADSVIVVTSGSMLWLPASTAHSVTVWEDSVLLPIHLDARRLTKRVPPVASVAIDEDLAALLLTAVQAKNTALTPSIDLDEAILDRVVRRVSMDPNRKVLMPHTPGAREVAQLLCDNPADERSHDELARQALMSVRTLERVFVAETGMPLGHWRRRMRLEAAWALLEEGATPNAVARRVGFATTSGFYRAFKQHFGCAPGAIVARAAR